MARKPKVLVVSPEQVAKRMAGPAIRARELAGALSTRCQVTLAAPPPSRLRKSKVRLRQIPQDNTQALLREIKSHDVVVAQSIPAPLLLKALETGTRIVLDLYDPLPIEAFEHLSTETPSRQPLLLRQVTAHFLVQLAAADYILSASDRQRDFWLGGMAMHDLIDSAYYREDPAGQSLLGTVPFGIPDKTPRHTKKVLKGVRPGIAASDKVILWGGGIWNWFDPLTVIQAVERLSKRRSDIKLFFLGVTCLSETM